MSTWLMLMVISMLSGHGAETHCYVLMVMLLIYNEERMTKMEQRLSCT